MQATLTHMDYMDCMDFLRLVWICVGLCRFIVIYLQLQVFLFCIGVAMVAEWLYIDWHRLAVVVLSVVVLWIGLVRIGCTRWGVRLHCVDILPWPCARIECYQGSPKATVWKNRVVYEFRNFHIWSGTWHDQVPGTIWCLARSGRSGTWHDQIWYLARSDNYLID
jgi:hypothetical protein